MNNTVKKKDQQDADHFFESKLELNDLVQMYLL